MQNDLYVVEEQLIKKLVKEQTYFKYNLSVIKNRLQTRQIRFHQTELQLKKAIDQLTQEFNNGRVVFDEIQTFFKEMALKTQKLKKGYEEILNSEQCLDKRIEQIEKSLEVGKLWKWGVEYDKNCRGLLMLKIQKIKQLNNLNFKDIARTIHQGKELINSSILAESSVASAEGIYQSYLSDFQTIGEII